MDGVGRRLGIAGDLSKRNGVGISGWVSGEVVEGCP